MINADRYIHVMMEESEGFKKWKQFFEGITVEWLIENYVSSRRRGQNSEVIVNIYTYRVILEIQWGNIVYVFSPPTVGQFELSFTEDKNIVRYLSIDVLREFIRILEL